MFNLQSFSCAIFDCDGTLWMNNQLLPGALKLLELLKSANKQVFLLTNNSSSTQEDYLKRCQRLGFSSLTENEIIGVSQVTADFIKRRNLQKLYVIGSEALQHELELKNIENIGVGIDSRISKDMSDDEIKSSIDEKVDGVLVGFDKHISLMKISLAATYVLQKKCEFFATNADPLFPQSGFCAAGTGTIVNAVATAVGRQPIIIGKPYKPIFDFIQSKLPAGTQPEHCLMVGDRLDTDIKFGNRFGMKTVLVMTGVTTPDTIAEAPWNDDALLKPDFTFKDLPELIESLESLTNT